MIVNYLKGSLHFNLPKMEINYITFNNSFDAFKISSIGVLDFAWKIHFQIWFV